MSYRIRTPKREKKTTTYDRAVAHSQHQPVVRRRSRGLIIVPRMQLGFAEVNWRWVSAGLVIIIGVVLAIVLTAEQFYVSRIEVGGLRTTPAEEIFAESGVAGYHVFWIDSEQVAQAIVDSPSIATADVRVQWPARVVIFVKEREPALVWEQDGVRHWVDVRGNLMPQRQDLQNLIRVISESPTVPVDCASADCLSGQLSIERDVVEGALQLKTLRADIDLLYYDPISGLSFDDPRGWRAHFGVDTDMNRKMLIYETIVSNLQTRGLFPLFVDVSNPEAPFYRLRNIPG